MRPRIGLAFVLDRIAIVDAEGGSNDVGVQLPLCLQGDIGGDGGVEVERCFCPVQIPAVEGIAVAGRGGGHGDFAAGDVVVVDIAVVVLRHGFQRCAVAVELDPVERQLTVEVIAFALALVTIVAVVVGHVLQLRPNGLADICFEVRRIRMRGVGAGFQLALDGIEPGTSDIRHLRERRKQQSRGHFADRDPLFVGVVIAAELAGRETGTCERGRVQRVLASQRVVSGINGLDEEVDRCGAPLRRQGDVLLNSSGEVILFIAQIPAVEGIAGLLGSSRLGRGEAVFHFLLGRNGRAAVGIKGNGVYLRHRYEALLLGLPAVPVPAQRDRIDLLIVLDMFQVRERLVELGHIEVGDIADVAKPVVPDLPRLVDEVVFIVLAEQIVAVLMLLQFIYDALDLNSHFKLFQLVSRRGFGLAGNLDDIVGCALIVCPLCCAVVFLQIQLDPDRFSRGVRTGVARVKRGNILRRLDLDRAELLLHRADHFEGARLKGHRPFTVRSIVRNALHDEIQIRVGKGRLVRSGHRRALDLDDCADASTGLTSGRDELPARAVVLPRDVGLLPGVRVGVRGVDLRILVERFDVLVFIKLDPVCPLAVGILPDIFAVHRDFRVSGGIRRVEIDILITRIRMLIASVLAMDENVIGELAHRGLAGLGGFGDVRRRLPQLPDGVEGGIRRDGDRAALRVSSTRRVWILIPAEEVIAISSRDRVGNAERRLTILVRIRNRGRHVGYRIVRDIVVVVQGVGFVTAVVHLGVFPHIDPGPARSITTRL